MLKHISIRGLFSLYDYEISLNGINGVPDKNIMFLTGPNGMGKSTILRSVASLYKQEMVYFLTFPFERIHFTFDASEVDIIQWMESVDVAAESDMPAQKTIYVKCIFTTVGGNSVSETGQWVLENGFVGRPTEPMRNMEMFFNSESCLYISDHRLEDGYDDAFVQPSVLRAFLAETQRLLTEGFSLGTRIQTTDQTKEERQKRVMETFNLLQRCEINLPLNVNDFNTGDNMSDFQLSCCENAISNCGDNIDILNSFCQFLSSSHFVGKKFRITMQGGLQFYAENVDKSFLKFEQLSLGEQNLISQIYTMYFSKRKYRLVLVDEPELSSHLMWQAQYLENIKNVQKLRGCAFLIATHSTVVFDGKFDLTTDLFEQTHR